MLFIGKLYYLNLILQLSNEQGIIPNTMSIFFKFLLRRFFGGIGIILLIICGIIYAVTFVERLPSNPDTISTMMDAWVRLLEYIPMFLPLATFMGTLLAMYNLTKSSEGIIISGAGMSPYQIAKPFLFGAAMHLQSAYLQRPSLILTLLVSVQKTSPTKNYNWSIIQFGFAKKQTTIF